MTTNDVFWSFSTIVRMGNSSSCKHIVIYYTCIAKEKGLSPHSKHHRNCLSCVDHKLEIVCVLLMSCWPREDTSSLKSGCFPGVVANMNLLINMSVDTRLTLRVGYLVYIRIWYQVYLWYCHHCSIGGQTLQWLRKVLKNMHEFQNLTHQPYVPHCS